MIKAKTTQTTKGQQHAVKTKDSNTPVSY